MEEDKRYGSMSPTVLIGNATEDQFKRQMGPSIVDRILETGGLFIFGWTSLRVEKRRGRIAKGAKKTDRGGDEIPSGANGGTSVVTEPDVS